MNILAIGDIIGRPGVEFIKGRLREIRKQYNVDFVVANGENSAPGNGVDPESAETILAAGVDMITTGNHVWQKKSIYKTLDESPYLLRPANYPDEVPGRGYTVVNVSGVRVLVMCVMGTVYMDALACPFRTVEKILAREQNIIETASGRAVRLNYDIALLEIHAEATSEKNALARFFDSRLSAMFGTHTHIQTSDICVLPCGTGFITDLGMTGPRDSVLGVKSECIIEKLTKKIPVQFEVPNTPVRFNAALFRVEPAAPGSVWLATAAESIDF